MMPDRLGAAGITGPDVGRLQRDGSLVTADGREVTLDAMSEPRRGQVFAFVMDTRFCEAALALADGADLVVCESTFLERDAGLAAAYGHMTAAQAARVAAEAGARQLVLTHFSQRYPDDAEFGAKRGRSSPTWWWPGPRPCSGAASRVGLQERRRGDDPHWALLGGVGVRLAGPGRLPPIRLRGAETTSRALMLHVSAEDLPHLPVCRERGA